MIGEKKNETIREKTPEVDSEWNDISNFVAAFAQNNEMIDDPKIEQRIVKETAPEETRIPAYQPQSDKGPKYGVGVSIQKEFHFMDKEFNEISGNYRSLRNELNEMLGELNEIREARKNLQSRLEKIS